MTTYWHIAGAGYEDGDDLLSFCDLLDAGKVTEADWRWEHAFGSAGDEQIVSLFESAARALAWIEDGGAPAGFRVVRVEIDEDDGRVRVRERHVDGDHHPYVMDRIPARCCAVVTLDELRAAAAEG